MQKSAYGASTTSVNGSVGRSHFGSLIFMLLSLQRDFLPTAAKKARPPTSLVYTAFRGTTRKLKGIHLRNLEKTPAAVFIFSFTRGNYGLPCSSCLGDLCVT